VLAEIADRLPHAARYHVGSEGQEDGALDLDKVRRTDRGGENGGGVSSNSSGDGWWAVISGWWWWWW
jgi:hypothetical protein